MIAFMVLNIICFVINGVASILIFVAIGIWAGVASAVTSKCNYIGGHCICTYEGQSYSYKGEEHKSLLRSFSFCQSANLSQSLQGSQPVGLLVSQPINLRVSQSTSFSL